MSDTAVQRLTHKPMDEHDLVRHLYSIRRNDVDESYALTEERPRPGVDYFDSASWSYTVTGKERAMKRLKELLKSR